jgi:hypothetical protein
MSQSIIISGKLDGSPVNARVLDQDFFPKKGDVVSIRAEPFYDGPTFEVRVKRILRNGDYILEAL